MSYFFSRKHLLALIILVGFFFACDNKKDDNVSSPRLEDDYEKVSFRVSASLDTAIMNGVIDEQAIDSFKDLQKKYPNLTTIVMEDVPGSADDEANLRLSRMIYDAKLNTHLPEDGHVASGGTDFFLAGRRRTSENSAKIGVHSWSDGDKQAIDYPRDSPEHQKYFDYYTYIGKTLQEAKDFYFFTIDVAPANKIHYMTSVEIKKYKVLTD